MALIGESGSGKTTLLRTFNRLVDPTSGHLEFAGRPLDTFDAIQLRRGFGYVQQEGGLIPHWTVARNVALVPTLLGQASETIATRVRELLHMVDLDPDAYAGRFPRTLSGGQRQRVAIARAMAADPQVVLLDEPFGALDPLTRGGMQDEFRELQRRWGKTLILVTHDLDEAFYLADRIVVMYQGGIEQVAASAELRENPTSNYVKRLLEQHRRHRQPTASSRRGGAT